MGTLSKQEKTRVIVFAAVSLLAVILTVWYAWGICDLMTSTPIEYDDVGHVYADGSDCTGAFIIFAGILNGMLMLVYFAAALVCMAISAAGAALTAVLMRIIALRTAEDIGAGEYGLVRKIFLTASIAQAAVSLLISFGYFIAVGSACGFVCLLLCWQYPLFMGLIYIKKLKMLTAAAG